MAALLGMSTREYRSLERGSTHTISPTIVSLALTGLRIRLGDRARSADSRAHKNDKRSEARANARSPKAPTRPTIRDNI